MSKEIQLRIVTPERVVYDDSVRMVIAHGVEGELGILYEHTPLVTPLKVSVLRVRKGDIFYPIAVSGGGFAEIKPDQVTVLTDSAELPEEIDVERAYEAKKRAEDRLSRREEDPGIDVLRANSALLRALARIQAAEKWKS